MRYTVLPLVLAFLTQTLANPTLTPLGQKPRTPQPRPFTPFPRAARQPQFSEQQLWNFTLNLWNNFIYPADVAQAEMINSTIFAPDVQGRVDVTRTFDGPELNTEYIFGLFVSQATNPNSVNLVGYPISYEVEQFSGAGNIVAVSVVVTFNATSFQTLVPVWIDVWLTFNAEGQITQYDATFKWFDYLLDTLIGITAQKLGTNDTNTAVTYLTGLLSQSICLTHQTYCNGTNQQYTDNNACLNFLETEVRFGKGYELGANTLLCRSLHQAMVPFRPEVHCPHIGPSGGGYCVDDYTYASKVTQKYFTNAPYIPAGLKS